MSPTRQAVTLSENFTGFGYRPDFTPLHQEADETGMTSGMICA